MARPVIFAAFGYLCGSVLFARIFGGIFHADGMLEESGDHNPGTANAFRYGGFRCGAFTLLGDLAKGFIPVHLLVLSVPFSEMDWRYAFALAAPVIGHIFPVFYRFKGGKGIAVTFGCLLGLLPYALPFIVLAAVFIFLSVVLKVTPHFYRTVLAYLCTAGFLFVFGARPFVRVGFLIITAFVCYRMHISGEVREKIRIRLTWMR